MPTFSILITSRNRSDLFINSLQSVLEQDFIDFEVVVSDNSDDAESAQTYAAIEPYLADSRVRYIRPAAVMNMTSHWEWAISQLRGDYVGILTDRMVYRLYTLSTVDAFIRKHDPVVVAFNTGNIVQSGEAFAIPRTPVEIDVVAKKTEPFISAFSKSDFRRMDMPRLLNSFVKQEFLTHLRSEYGAVFAATAPDYGFFMRVVDQLDEFPFITNTLLVKHSESRSNGKSFTNMSMTKASYDFIEFNKREQGEYIALSPIPDDLLLVSNIMVREYECGRHYAKYKKLPPYDKQAFYSESMRLIRSWANAGKDVSSFRKQLQKYRTDHCLKEARPSWQEVQKRLKTKIRSVVGVRRKKIKPLVSVDLYPTIVEALRRDAAQRRVEHVFTSEGT